MLTSHCSRMDTATTKHKAPRSLFYTPISKLFLASRKSNLSETAQFIITKVSPKPSSNILTTTPSTKLMSRMRTLHKVSRAFTAGISTPPSTTLRLPRSLPYMGSLSQEAPHRHADMTTGQATSLLFPWEPPLSFPGGQCSTFFPQI